MNDVVFFFPSGVSHNIRRLQGVYAFAREIGWQVLTAERFPMRTNLKKLIDFWNPIGFIIEDGGEEKSLLSLEVPNLPLVFCDVGTKVFHKKNWENRAAFVVHEGSGAVKMAFEELSRRGTVQYAFVGYLEPAYWSDERAELFLKHVEKAGGQCHFFLAKDNRHFSNVTDFQRKLEVWLKELPKPCNILAANDFMAAQILSVCGKAGIDVPRQVSIMGIDNDEMICENVRTTLSSIEPDFTRAGYIAAKLLNELRLGKAHVGDYRTFGSARMVRRSSTNVVPVKAKCVAAALEMIRLRACDGLSAAEVLVKMGGCRSAAEKLFRQVVGCSVLEKINETRLDEVIRLAANPALSIDNIVSRCGYVSSSFLRKKFVEKFGMPLSEWRKELRE